MTFHVSFARVVVGSIAFLGGVASALARPAALVAVDDPPIEVVDCGDTATGSATYTQVGRHCTGGNPDNHVDDALAKANAAFVDWVTDSHACSACPAPQSGCTATSSTNPTPPFDISQCTIVYTPGCQGNPYKTLVTVTCTGVVSWAYACDYCHGQ